MEAMKGVMSSRRKIELVMAKKIPPRGETKNAMRPPIVRTVGNI